MNVRRGDSLPTVWPRPAHTKAKHDILVKYLQAWFGIMGNSPYDPKVGVFDGFAGPGVYTHDEPGSPVLLLEALLDHEHFSRWAGTVFLFLFNETAFHGRAAHAPALCCLGHVVGWRAAQGGL
jgi:hypothetical protein